MRGCINIKSPECGLNKENYLQWKMEFQKFSRFKRLQYALKKVGNTDILASECTDLSSDDETNKNVKITIK